MSNKPYSKNLPNRPPGPERELLKLLAHSEPEVRGLTFQANYLLDKQLAALEAAFVDEGGFSERLYRVRLAHRKKQQGGIQS